MIDGEPIILVENGQTLLQNLRRQRITVEEVQSEARLSKISSLEDVRWAILETNGRISFVEKSGSTRG